MKYAGKIWERARLWPRYQEVIIGALFDGHVFAYTCNYIADPSPGLRPARRSDGRRVGQREAANRQIADFRRAAEYGPERQTLLEQTA